MITDKQKVTKNLNNGGQTFNLNKILQFLKMINGINFNGEIFLSNKKSVVGD